MSKWLLILSLGISSGTILFDRYVFSISNSVVIVLSIISVACMIWYIVRNRKYRNEKEE